MTGQLGDGAYCQKEPLRLLRCMEMWFIDIIIYLKEFNFLWRIPLKERYYHVLKYWANYRKFLPKKSIKKLAKFVAEIQSGRLEKLIDKMCGNKKNAVISITPKDNE